LFRDRDHLSSAFDLEEKMSTRGRLSRRRGHGSGDARIRKGKRRIQPGSAPILMKRRRIFISEERLMIMKRGKAQPFRFGKERGKKNSETG